MSSSGLLNLTQEDFDEKPWKYIGYKGYSEFIASEDDFLIFRRFNVANTRVMLALQDQVSELTEHLKQLDDAYSDKTAKDTNNGSLRHDQRDRKALLQDLHESLVKYNSFTIQQITIGKQPRPNHCDVMSLQNWHWNHGNAIAQNEYQYLSHGRDLLSVIPRDKNPLRRLLHRSRLFRLNSFWKKDRIPDIPLYDKGTVTYYSDKRMDRFITCAIVAIGIVMLIVPMWILNVLQSSNLKLGVISVFIVLFVSLVSSVTVAKPFETLAATAAYSAVLIVFMQLGNSPPS